MNSERIAAIDIGSNSVHLAITEVSTHGRFKVLDSHKEVIRLASYLDDLKNISQEGIERTIQALINMKALASPYKPKFVAVATQATRAAANHEEFVRQLCRQTGIDVRVIDGVEEAKLTFLGVRYSLPIDDCQTLELDIGGGSTEILIGSRTDTPFVISLPLGTVSLSKKFFGFKNAKKSDFDALKDHIANEMKPYRDRIKQLKFDYAVATSGTAKALATINFQRQFGGNEKAPNGYAFRSKDIHKLLQDFVKLSSPNKIAANYQVDEQRSEIIIAGTAIMDAISDIFRVNTWRFCSYGLREGLAIQTFIGTHALQEASPQKVRETSLQLLGQKFDLDEPYAQGVQHLSLSFYKQMLPYILRRVDFSRHTDEDTQILTIASYLSEIGWFISPTRVHRHSHYILSNCNLDGYHDEVRQLASLVIRYSKKGIDADDEVRDPLLTHNHKRINVLASCLMVGKALNRTRNRLIKDVKVDLTGTTIRIAAEYVGDFPRLEQAQFQKIAPHVARCFGRPISLHLKLRGNGAAS